MIATMILAGALLLGAEETVELKEVGVTLPRTIGKLEFKERHEYDQSPGLGYDVSYQNRMCRVTLYVYDLNEKGIPDGKTAPRVLEELDNAIRDMKGAERAGALKHVLPIEGPLGLPDEIEEKFATAGFTYDVPGGGCKGYVLLTGRAGHFVKIRITQYVVDGKTNDDELKEFLVALAGRFGDETE